MTVQACLSSFIIESSFSLALSTEPLTGPVKDLQLSVLLLYSVIKLFRPFLLSFYVSVTTKLFS